MDAVADTDVIARWASSQQMPGVADLSLARSQHLRNNPSVQQSPNYAVIFAVQVDAPKVKIVCSGTAFSIFSSDSDCVAALLGLLRSLI
ncbi:hypothetical protein Kisp02_31570 [Kineosporia sp. NBRC 101731]|nr:hypothetical protein Kisp02_31570 [Kineosporia sp. NBRC 101731]